MHYSTKTGERLPNIPEDTSDIWAELPEEYEWQTWLFDGTQYRPKTAAEAQAERRELEASRLSALWAAANQYAEHHMDANSRHSINLMLADSGLSTAKQDMILEYAAWWQSLWTYYGSLKALVLSGQDATFDPAVPGPCPWTIWQIAGDTP